MKTYTCNRCELTVENPVDWMEVLASPLRSSSKNLSALLFKEDELHYCPKCAEIMRRKFNEKRVWFK